MILYKYVPAARVDVLKNNRICFTKPNNFNDPFDCKTYIKGISTLEDFNKKVWDAEDFNASLNTKIAEELIPNMENVINDLYEKSGKPIEDKENFIKQCFLQFNPYVIVKNNIDLMEKNFPQSHETVTKGFNKKFHNDISEKIGILCLTEKPDNLLMWSHYADSHKGFVIGFDASKPFFTEKPNNELFNFCKVNYKSERSKKYITDANFSKTLFIKSKDWKYEHEWRLFKPIKEAIYLDENKKNPLISFDPAIINCIILGCRMEDTQKQDIIKLCKNEKLQHITIFKAEEDDKEFKINIKEVTNDKKV